MTDERLAQIRELAEAEGVFERGDITCSLTRAGVNLLQELPSAIPSLLTLLDEQKKRIEELESTLPGRVAGTQALADEKCRCFLARATDAEARASRAEQATVKADLARNAAEVECGLLRAALSTERERVIQECAAVVENIPMTSCYSMGNDVNTGLPTYTYLSGPSVMLGTVLAAIRALSSLPTPPQTQWIRCEDFVPEYGTVSLVYCREIGGDGSEKVHPIQRLATYSYHGGWCVGDSLESGREYHVTHWQPLPTPPEEEKA